MTTPTPEPVLSPVERYAARRISMEKYFVPENAQPDPKIHKSPSGRYTLKVTGYATKPGAWAYSRGEVYDGEKLVGDVKRNYSHFPFSWAEAHENGHDYLVCGEDYQGQTTIELDTGARADSGATPDTMKGFGFCWSSMHPSPDKRVLAVDGCYWACPYEVVLFDFREPMKLPYPELERWEDMESFDSWKTTGIVTLSRTEDVRKSDGKSIDLLTEEELDAADLAKDWGEKKTFKQWEPKCLSEVRS